jgi:hypothetical protein
MPRFGKERMNIRVEFATMQPYVPSGLNKRIAMRLAGFGTALSLIALVASGAMAEPATPEGAARIQAALAKYLGPAAGVATVTPKGEVYDLVLDGTAVVTPLLPAGGTFTMTPYTIVLTDLGGGKWQMDESGSFSAALKIPNLIEFAYTIDTIKGQSIWDEALMATETVTYDFTGIKTVQTTFNYDGTPMVSTTEAASLQLKSNAVAGANGGVDATVTYSQTGVHQDQEIPIVPGQAPLKIVVDYPLNSSEAVIKGFRTAAFYDLIGWAVAQKSADAAMAAQAEAKDKIRALLPIFESASISGVVTDAKVSTPVGEFAVAGVDVSAALSGFVSDGNFSEKVTLKGFSMPAGLLPDWSAGLVPTDLTLDFAIDDFNLAAPMATIVETFDASAPEPIPEAMMFPLLSQFLPNGNVSITLGDSGANSAVYDLSASGSLKAGFMGAEGAAHIELIGIDAVLAALQAGPPEETGEIVGMLGMAQSLAKPGVDGALVWDFTFTPPAGISVNGTPLTP